MRKVQKGFTLVELIVVITILAILGTIAFISLQGYSQDARNSKVTSDIRTLVSSIETKLTDGGITLGALVTGDLTGTNSVGSGASDTFGPAAVSFSGATYAVGSINFVSLRQNGADFKDNNGNDYVVATASAGSENSFYQVAGQTQNTDGTYQSVVRGNYVAGVGAVTGLISASGATNTGGIVNDANIGTGGLYN